MRRLYTADLHIGHRLVAGLRGFETPVDHDEALVEAWNRAVSPRDSVWILGDVTSGSFRDYHRGVVERLNGTLHLVSGNHDGTHPMHRDAHKRLPGYGTVFASIQPAGRHRLPDGTEVLLNHFPYAGDHAEVQRYDQWRLPDLGVPLLCGHVHDAWQRSLSPRGTVQVNVGLDHRPIPWAADDLVSVIASGNEEP